VLDARCIGVGHIQYNASHLFERTALQWFCEKICKHVRRRAKRYFDFTFFDFVCYKEIPYIDVPGSL